MTVVLHVRNPYPAAAVQPPRCEPLRTSRFAFARFTDAFNPRRASLKRLLPICSDKFQEHSRAEQVAVGVAAQQRATEPRHPEIKAAYESQRRARPSSIEASWRQRDYSPATAITPAVTVIGRCMRRKKTIKLAANASRHLNCACSNSGARQTSTNRFGPSPNGHAGGLINASVTKSTFWKPKPRHDDLTTPQPPGVRLSG